MDHCKYKLPVINEKTKKKTALCTRTGICMEDADECIGESLCDKCVNRCKEPKMVVDLCSSFEGSDNEKV